MDPLIELDLIGRVQAGQSLHRHSQVEAVIWHPTRWVRKGQHRSDDSDQMSSIAVLVQGAVPEAGSTCKVLHIHCEML